MGVWDELAKPEVHARLLTHPYQVAVRDTVLRLITELRAVSERSEMRTVQEHLLSALVEAERQYSEQSRLAKRGGGDATELLFWRRAVAELRTVGDAIAWRFLGYRRQWILLMGQNQPAGLFLGKQGSDDEWELFNRHWDAGEPTLLTAITAAIRLGDLLVEEGNVLRVYEVKRNPGRRIPRRQLHRLEQLVRQINEEPRLGGTDGQAWVLESDVPYGSYWSFADSALAAAAEEGFATWVPAPGVALLIIVPRSARPTAPEEVQARLAQLQADARAKIGPVTHRIVARTSTRPASALLSVPPASYPVRPDFAAMLVAGEILTTVEVSVDALAERLRAEGLETRIVLPEQNTELRSESPLLAWRDGERRGIVHAGLMNELALDLTDLSSWARAMANAPEPPTVSAKWSGYLCLAGEDQVWEPRIASAE